MAAMRLVDFRHAFVFTSLALGSERDPRAFGERVWSALAPALP